MSFVLNLINNNKKVVNKFNTMDDNQLVEIVRGAKPDSDNAFVEIYERYSRKVYIYCKKAVVDLNFVEDVYQDVFIRFYNSIKNGYAIINVQSYLFKIARNLCLNFKRDNKQILIQLEEFHLNDYFKMEDDVELIDAINSAIELLNDEYRDALMLQTFHSLSYNEIAEILDIPVTTVRNRLVRAKRRLKELLHAYFD